MHYTQTTNQAPGLYDYSRYLQHLQSKKYFKMSLFNFTVEIFTSNDVTAKLEWIKYIKTADAMQKFYRFITGKMENWERISNDVEEMIRNKE